MHTPTFTGIASWMSNIHVFHGPIQIYLLSFMKVSIYISGDSDKENRSVSISTASSQDVESVVSEKISSFGIEIQHHMQASNLFDFNDNYIIVILMSFKI